MLSFSRKIANQYFDMLNDFVTKKISSLPILNIQPNGEIKIYQQLLLLIAGLEKEERKILV